MSEYLLIDVNQLYSIYSIDEIDSDYYDFSFLPEYNSIDVDIIYDILNCLSLKKLNQCMIYIYKQWSLLKKDPEVNTLSTAKRRKHILSKKLKGSPCKSKEEWNEKISQFINKDKIFALYVINQILKFLYPCKL